MLKNSRFGWAEPPQYLKHNPHYSCYGKGIKTMKKRYVSGRVLKQRAKLLIGGSGPDIAIKSLPLKAQ